MKRGGFVFCLIIIFLACLVLAQNIPPANPPDISEKKPFYRCIDSDGGINYYVSGNISFEDIQENQNQPYHEKPIRDISGTNTGPMDHCVSSPKNHSSYGTSNASRFFIAETYCDSENLERYLEVYYDCSSENKVCWNGACVIETSKIKKYYEQQDRKRESFFNFFRAFFLSRINRSGKISFSATDGVLIDENGFSINGAGIKQSYSCSSGDFMQGGDYSDESITNKDGEFFIDSYTMNSTLKEKYCKKHISVYAEGYCDSEIKISYAHCLNQYSKTNSSERDYSLIMSRQSFKSNEKKIEITLKKFNPSTAKTELEEIGKELGIRKW